MAGNPYQDPNFLRRQRENREADKKAKAAAEPVVLDPASRQKAIDARIQELLDQQPGV